jgi:hypothetical protein
MHENQENSPFTKSSSPQNLMHFMQTSTTPTQTQTHPHNNHTRKVNFNNTHHQHRGFL